jgi:hypothetical protein
MHQCRICGMQLPLMQMRPHVTRCVERNADVVDAYRPVRPFEGDPELARFAREEGSVWNRRPGTRRQPR